MAEYARKTAVELGPKVIHALWERGTQTVIDDLDSRGFPQQHGFNFTDLIYPKKIGRCGRLDPTDEYLASGAMLKKWRRLSGKDQNWKIGQVAEAAVVTMCFQSW